MEGIVNTITTGKYRFDDEKGLIFQKGLVVGAYENAVGDECTELSPLGQKIDDQLGGKLRNALNG